MVSFLQMAKAHVVSVSVFNAREVTVRQQFRPASAELGVQFHLLTCSRHQLCSKSSLSSRSLRVGSTYEGVQGSKWPRCTWAKWAPWGCQPSSSFFTVLPERIGPRGSRHTKRLKRRHAKNEEGPLLDWQWSPSAVIGAEGKSESESISKVEIVNDDDEDDESGDRVLEEQFNRFAMAMAMQDNKMAEQVMKEMGHSVKMGDMKDLVNEMSDMEEQLQELHDKVNKLIEEGDDDSARDLIEANHEVIVEQLESGYRGMEQLAMLDILAQLRMSLGDFEEAEYLLDQTKDLMKDIGVDSTKPFADSILEHVGSMYTALGKPAEGLPFFRRSVAIQEELLGKQSPLIVKTLLGLATTYVDMDETPSAIEVYKRVLLILEKTRGPTDESLALPLSHLGHCLLDEGRVDEAELAMLRALKLVEKAFGPRDGRVGVASCALARAKASKGEVDESVSLYRRGLEIMGGCSTFRDDDPTLETVRTDLAELLNLLERNDEAEELWEENLLIKEKVVGQNDPALVGHLQNLATSYAVAGKYEKCEPLLRRSLKLTTANLGPNAPQVSIPLECLATALHHMGRQYEAEPLARQALHIREAAFGPDSAIVGEACNCLASILHSIGRFEEALALMKRVLAIQENVVGPDSPEIALTLQLMIMLLDKLGRIDDIEPLYLRLAMLSAKTTGEDDMPETDV